MTLFEYYYPQFTDQKGKLGDGDREQNSDCWSQSTRSEPPQCRLRCFLSLASVGLGAKVFTVLEPQFPLLPILASTF